MGSALLAGTVAVPPPFAVASVAVLPTPWLLPLLEPEPEPEPDPDDPDEGDALGILVVEVARMTEPEDSVVLYVNVGAESWE